MPAPAAGNDLTDPTTGGPVDVQLVPRNVWRIGFVIVAVVSITMFGSFVVEDGGPVIFTVLMAWFGSIAMEPAVGRLAKRMRRGLATMITMLAFLVFLALFSLLFGRLFVEQIVEIVKEVPDLVEGVLKWVNETFGMELTLDSILESLNLNTSRIPELATEIGTNFLGILGSVLGSVFSIFTLVLFTFYLSADGPRLRRWVAQMFPQRAQGIVINVWDLTTEKTGGYVAARLVLAAINGATSALVFAVIGMPFWLALGIWTGLVAQFVPTIGTYISIILPVIVGLLSPNPWVGVMALVWALIYQQVENLTFEPRISARAVNVHPAVAFGSVMMGAALFGVAGALLAVPVTAMLLALLQIYARRYELLPELVAAGGGGPPPAEPAASDQAAEPAQ